MNRSIKAVALISGGLDSLLAAKVVQEQGVELEGINFFTGFCVEGHTHAIRKKERERPRRNNALWVAEQLGIKLHIVDIHEEYKDVLLNPQYGYGKNMNPCLDCKIMMVNKALEWGQQRGFDFLVTGEVVGQRPMSQRKDTMQVVSRYSGAGDRLLRPLCAKNMVPTLAEREGWVDRDQLYDFNGRSRKPQMALAARFGFEEYAQPAGGCCFLTDAQYSARLVDLWEARGDRNYEMEDIMLLKVGRHLRPCPHFKMIVAREEGESQFLNGYRKEYAHMKVVSHGGPVTLIDGQVSDAEVELAARVVARYSQGKHAEQVEVEYVDRQGHARQLMVAPLQSGGIPEGWHV